MPIDNVKIKIADGSNHNHRISQFFIDFDQPLNKATGHTSGVTSLTQCMVMFELPVDIPITEILQWEFEQNQTMPVEIEFYDNQQLIKSYKLSDTYLVSLEQTIIRNQDNSLVQQLRLHLSPLSVEMDDSVFEVETEI